MSLWDDLIANGENAVDALLGVAENYRLEFKTKAEPNHPKLTPKDQQILGRAMSAFSNAAGGVLIFGIQTERKNRDDVAVKLCPIEDIGRFKSNVESWISHLLTPVNEGIRVHAIRCMKDENRGFVAIQIPESGDKPVMSIAKSHSSYFLRTLSGTIPMDDRLVRQAILAKQSARFEVWLEPRRTRKETLRKGIDLFRLRFHIILRNVSRVSAVAPYVRVAGWWERQTQSFHPFERYGEPGNKSVALTTGGSFLIHPDQSCLVGSLTCVGILQSEQRRREMGSSVEGYEENHDLWQFAGTTPIPNQPPSDLIENETITLRIGAQNSPQEDWPILLSKGYLISKCTKAGVI